MRYAEPERTELAEAARFAIHDGAGSIAGRPIGLAAEIDDWFPDLCFLIDAPPEAQ